MPLNRAALKRRRRLLGISQADLSIMAGVTEQTVGRIERGTLADEGGHVGVDVFMRLCAALQMEYRELLIPPAGNRYQGAAIFAKMAHRPSEAPKYHDQGDSVRARGLRALTSVSTDRSEIDRDERDDHEREAEDELERLRRLAGSQTVFAPGEAERVAARRAEILRLRAAQPDPSRFDFTPDPSSE